MSDYPHKSEKCTYKCSHCHDISVILANNHKNEPICPLCKGLLITEAKNTSFNQDIRQVSSF